MAKVFMGMSLTKRIEGELYHIWSAYTALCQADRDAGTTAKWWAVCLLNY